ncbi:PP2C family protein-serine/threonine phosphatase [Methylobacter tundripaludum]|uniref:Protein serine/threonine phosphatase n=1 Tax=Methylobacter tundripaludum (strain ATCC BAA-1195 / DSM 17260 / SV96) TaxID=697282 RepID=G3ISF1_METTV|nr:PP2C family serine/threonine-protein phosphatase [Methylobacter tundripaludum]EGW22321.1 protein serine/threonine phosphatase [Methylobacter tundripaludum SV96]
MALEFYQLTSRGDREINQDFMAHVINDSYALFVVADGLGGHHAGEKASCFFCQGLLRFADTYAKQMVRNPVDTFSIWIAAAVNEMRRLFAFDKFGDDAHTTCAILYLDEQRVLTAHCGDSRIYRMNPQQVLWRTRDHSIPQQLLNEGMITEQEMARHPEQNKLTRSINILKADEVEINLYPAMKKGETFMLCSDGFWEYVKQAELLQLAQPDGGKDELAKLVQLAIFRAHGKSDNVTAQWVRRP